MNFNDSATIQMTATHDSRMFFTRLFLPIHISTLSILFQTFESSLPLVCISKDFGISLEVIYIYIRVSWGKMTHLYFMVLSKCKQSMFYILALPTQVQNAH